MFYSENKIFFFPLKKVFSSQSGVSTSRLQLAKRQRQLLWVGHRFLNLNGADSTKNTSKKLQVHVGRAAPSIESGTNVIILRKIAF
jgi:hypothetical protein